MNSGKKTTFLCIMFFIIGGCVTLFLYLSLFPTYSGSVQGGYFKNYLKDKNTINLNDFNKTIGKGNSMYPTFPEDSISLIIQDEISIGDIILFENTGSFPEDYDYISHRVIKIRLKNGKTEYLTRGDNVKYSDGWVSEDYVRGKVVGVLY